MVDGELGANGQGVVCRAVAARSPDSGDVTHQRHQMVAAFVLDLIQLLNFAMKTSVQVSETSSNRFCSSLYYDEILFWSTFVDFTVLSFYVSLACKVLIFSLKEYS